MWRNVSSEREDKMSRSALLGTPQLSKGDRLTGLGLRDGNVSDTKVRYGPERSVRRSEPEWTRGISKKQETARSRTAVVGMAERELRGRDRRFRRRDRRRDRRPEVTGGDRSPGENQRETGARPLRGRRQEAMNRSLRRRWRQLATVHEEETWKQR
ncbi:hypothetical protein B0H16DRAFT_1686538 [Mycena metata]|uniref:Uncharacterized protein n=1 Tax=Mycena metata TaxID=1033252 RepID=A0AAD7JN66_9AGAR|nr:hypothetical protein B0H16DRAFT_1686538 [Mycena metata]